MVANDSPSPAPRICSCGARFPADRAPQARYHSDRCAAAHRKAAERERDSVRNVAEWDSLEPVDRAEILARHGVPPSMVFLIVAGFNSDFERGLAA